uniref:Uncharacterized protein n=1 Tax=Anopheles coluzzii TaxID=1518534 RepID=A0A8W7P535_ANOCL
LMDPAHHLRASVTELPIAPPPSSPYSSTAIDGPVANRRLLPASADRLPPDGRDLLHRLLEPDPRARLRSLLQLQRIALYQHYRWEDVRTRKIVPRDLFDDECLVREEDAFLFTDF